MRYLVNISYDGNYFYGFQKQKNKMGVQNKIEEVFSKILNENISIVAASRTDRYVHAYNQYFHFDTLKDLNIQDFKYRVNKMINKEIYIKNIIKVSDDFHARYNVKSKTYLYKINIGTYNPIEKNYILQYNKEIDIVLLKKACKKIKGKHDFKSFTSDKDKDNYVRDIKNIEVVKEKNYVYIKVEASGFLRYMVRNIVGLLIDINDEKIKISDINDIFIAKDRSKINKPAPANALYLEKIIY